MISMWTITFIDIFIEQWLHQYTIQKAVFRYVGRARLYIM